MKYKLLWSFALAVLILPAAAIAQDADTTSTIQAQYSYRVHVLSQPNEDAVNRLNALLSVAQSRSRNRSGEHWGEALGDQYADLLLQ